MGFDEGLSIFLWLIIVVAVIVLIVDYRKGKRGLAMTTGLILFGLGFAGEGLLPVVPPGLAIVHSRPALLGFILMLFGLLLILGSWWATRRNKREG